MAEEFLQGGVSWWNSPQNLFNSSLCSSAYNGIGSFDWPSNDLMMDTKTVWPASASEGSSSAAVQDVHQPDGHWNHEFLIDCGRSDQNYPNFLLENSNSNNFCEDSSIHTLDQSLLGNQPAPNSYQQVNSDGFLLSPSFKRPRIETPSPLPTFKVRKEKLGDRITALQQLVSPFGKTDTASVLHEAIEYIKFLHDQISAFSAPYVKYGSPPVHQQVADKQKDQKRQAKDLKARGLCLVPIPTTFPVASETTNSDFWTPTFGRSFE